MTAIIQCQDNNHRVTYEFGHNLLEDNMVAIQKLVLDCNGIFEVKSVFINILFYKDMDFYNFMLGLSNFFLSPITYKL